MRSRFHWLILSLFTWCGAALADSRADADWNVLVAVDAVADSKSGTREQRRGLREASRLLYRELGVEFYRNFPQDPRRWQWLVNTAQKAPTYADAPSQESWDQLVERELRPALFASPQAGSGLRLKWLEIELYRIRDRDHERHFGRGEAVDVERCRQYLSRFMQYAAEPAAAGSTRLSGLWSTMRWYLRVTGMDHDGQQAILEQIAQTPNPQLRGYVAGMQRILALRTAPLSLQFKTLDGSAFRVEDFRGKVVLVDFWYTGCSSCMAAMPGIKDLYQRLHPQGLEVIGVCMDPRQNEPKVRALLREFDLPWQTAFEPWDETALRDRFGINAAPLYLVLDRSGRLVSATVSGSELEAAVLRALGLAAGDVVEKPPATERIASRSMAACMPLPEPFRAGTNPGRSPLCVR